jgi:hypothetical protein
MNLRPTLYEALPPKARARAWLAALARRDEAEMLRLVTPDRAGRRAILTLGQGLEAVNVSTLSASSALWQAAAWWTAREAWLEGYAAAGGDVTAPEYEERARAADAALARLRARDSEHAAVRQAVAEWAEREGLALADVYGALSLSDPEGFGERVADPETLQAARRTFEPLRTG